MMVSGILASNKGTGSIYTQTALNMKASGKIIVPMVWEYAGLLITRCMKDSGRTIKYTAKVNLQKKMKRTLANGLMENVMVMDN